MNIKLLLFIYKMILLLMQSNIITELLFIIKSNILKYYLYIA